MAAEGCRACAAARPRRCRRVKSVGVEGVPELDAKAARRRVGKGKAWFGRGRGVRARIRERQGPDLAAVARRSMREDEGDAAAALGG